jgi:hypothetical protein
MRKGRRPEDAELRREYDFASMSGGVRGKYVARLADPPASGRIPPIHDREAADSPEAPVAPASSGCPGQPLFELVELTERQPAIVLQQGLSRLLPPVAFDKQS